MFKRPIFIGILMLSTLSIAQQIPQYSQYMRNQILVNPGATGVYDFTDITAGGRMQWAGFENAPRTGYITVAAPLRKKIATPYDPGIRVSQSIARNPEIKTGKTKHALGGQILFDQYGAFQRVGADVKYALHLPISKTYNMSFGVSAGMSNNTFLEDRAIVLNPTTDVTYQNFIAESGNRFTADLGAGLYFYSKKSFFGISASHLTQDFISFGTNTANFDNQLHYHLTGGYKFSLTENLTLTPAFLVKYMSPSPVSIDVSAQVEYMEWIWGAISYRNNESIIGMAGLNISNKFKIGYSYDFGISQMNHYSNGGHELILGIMLGRK